MILNQRHGDTSYDTSVGTTRGQQTVLNISDGQRRKRISYRTNQPGGTLVHSTVYHKTIMQQHLPF